jgi:hypothetical protein
MEITITIFLVPTLPFPVAMQQSRSDLALYFTRATWRAKFSSVPPFLISISIFCRHAYITRRSCLLNDSTSPVPPSCFFLVGVTLS